MTASPPSCPPHYPSHCWLGNLFRAGRDAIRAGWTKSLDPTATRGTTKEKSGPSSLLEGPYCTQIPSGSLGWVCQCPRDTPGRPWYAVMLLERWEKVALAPSETEPGSVEGASLRSTASPKGHQASTISGEAGVSRGRDSIRGQPPRGGPRAQGTRVCISWRAVPPVDDEGASFPPRVTLFFGGTHSPPLSPALFPPLSPLGSPFGNPFRTPRTGPRCAPGGEWHGNTLLRSKR